MKKETVLSNSFLNFVPLVCAIMVVGMHNYNISAESSNIAIRVEGFFCHGVFCLAVPMFFFMSGYLFFLTATSHESVKNKIKRRIKSVIIPYFLWSASYALFYYVSYYFLHIPMENAPILTGKAFFEAVLYHKYCFHMWYLATLSIFIMLTPVIYEILRKKSVSILCVITLLAFNIFGKSVLSLRGGGIVLRFNFLIYFLIGAIVSRNNKELIQYLEERFRVYRWRQLISGAIAFLSFSFISSLFFDGVIIFPNNRVAVLLVFATGFYFLYVVTKLVEFSSRWNGITMIIYGIHPLVGQFINRAIDFLHFSVLTDWLFTFLLTVGVSLYVACMLKKYCKSLYRLYSGNR